MRTIARNPQRMPRILSVQKVADGLRDMVEGMRGIRVYRKKEDAALLRAMQEGGAEARTEVSREDINAILAKHGLGTDVAALFAMAEARKHEFQPILSAYGEDEPDYTNSIKWHNPNYQPSSPAI